MKQSLKYLLYVLILAFAVSCGSDPELELPDPGPEPPPPTAEIELAVKEMRAAWIATVWSLDWPQNIHGVAGQKKKYTDLLETLAAAKLNAVFVQIRPTADAFYNSQYEPWSRWITGTAGQDPGYDVLAFMIEETHKRGLEFHAWMNPYRITTRTDKSVSFPALDSKIPANLIKDYDKIRIYNPALPAVHQRIADIVKDMITKYDVDGIHFDDYFYPDPGDYASTGLNDATEYTQYGTGYSSVAAFRRGNVDKMVQKIYETIVQYKPGVAFTISPAGSPSYNDELYADTKKWCQQGWVDAIIPQLYSATGSASSSTTFTYRVGWWDQNSYNAIPMVGYALNKFGDGESTGFQTTVELVKQFAEARFYSKIKGSVWYSAKYFDENKMGIVNVIKQQLYPRPAIIPFLGRKTVAESAPVSNVSISDGKLTWNAASGLRTIIYKVENKKGLVVAITSDREYTLTEKGDYCLTTLNEDNVESTVQKITYQ
ncbi:glycoside hydrolase family 10 protein [Dysgonomonas reticulitermitis]